MKTKVTKQIIQKCVLELYYNTYCSLKLSISAIANKLSLSKCLAYLKERCYSGEIYKIKSENRIKVKTSYHI